MRAVLGAVLFVSAAHAAVTYNEHIAPILREYCASCHRPGQSAPFPLLTYDDARRRAAQIASVTRRRYMPPWLPEHGFGDFAGERRLTEQQIRSIEEWARTGAPEGDRTMRTAPPPASSDWALGPPDLVIEAPRDVAVPADGADLFWNFILSPAIRETRYVKAIEVRPGNPRLTHHANVVLDRARSSRRREASPGAGFPGMDLSFESDTFDPDSHFLFWKPGAAPRVEPEGMAWRLDPGVDLILNMHLRPTGKPETIRPAVGLYFTETPPTKRPMLLKIENDRALDIPAGARDYVIAEDFRLPLNVQVLAVYPHAHYLGRLLDAFATLPDGSHVPLIRIPDWDPAWQSVYSYRQPLPLPNGTVVSMRYHYDNSSANPRNPHAPPRRVRSGNQADDEMAHLWLQVLPLGPADGRPILQEWLLRHRIEKHSDDAPALLGLGALLLSRGDAPGATSALRDGLRFAPNDPQGLNNLGAALKLQGRAADAIPLFRQALEAQPDYPTARFNLGTALAADGRLAEAAVEFRRVLAASPADREARDQLIAALTELAAKSMADGNVAAAAESYRELVALDPNSADLRNNFGILLARTGDLTGAIAQFEAALRIQPSHESARRNLERLRNRP